MSQSKLLYILVWTNIKSRNGFNKRISEEEENLPSGLAWINNISLFLNVYTPLPSSMYFVVVSLFPSTTLQSLDLFSVTFEKDLL